MKEIVERSAFRRRKGEKKVIFVFQKNVLPSLEQCRMILFLVLPCAYVARMQDLIFTRTLLCHLVPPKLHAHLMSSLYVNCKVLLFPSLLEPYLHSPAQAPSFFKIFPEITGFTLSEFKSQTRIAFFTSSCSFELKHKVFAFKRFPINYLFTE